MPDAIIFADELAEIADGLDNVRDHLRSVRDRLIDIDDDPTVTVRLELTPLEAATLHHFILARVDGYGTQDSLTALLDMRMRLLHALKDAGVLS